ncbi:MAG: protease inhibitor I42 family protein [Bacilli bacterium]|mgnify:FL=1|nr:protease inhibitor I42 family protein [Mycoplasmatota bacterium]MDY4237296.1 protease inhibitor I42 family protein [Bacilli bacterium]
MKKIYLIILLCLFLLVGCGNKKNYEINITLKGEDSSYKWEYQGNIDKTFELKKEEQITNDDNTKTYIYKLEPLKEGTTSIAFKYKNGENVLYLIKYDIEVSKDLSAKVLNVETNYDNVEQEITINEIK